MNTNKTVSNIETDLEKKFKFPKGFIKQYEKELNKLQLFTRINNKLEEEKKPRKKRSFVITVKRPEHSFEKNPYKEVRHSKDRAFYARVLALIDQKKYVRFSDGDSIVHLSCKNQFLVSLCGSIHNASYFIRRLQVIGLISVYDDKWVFNQEYKWQNKCKAYVWHKEVEDKIIALCKERGIAKAILKNAGDGKERIEKIESFDAEQVRFSSKLNLMKPENLTDEKFEEYINQCLSDNYEQLSIYQEKADRINREYYADDIPGQIRFKPRITFGRSGKSIRKIGIRATNGRVSIKKESEEVGQVIRKDVLEQLGTLNEYDVTSSVPKVTNLLNTGKWETKTDFYKKAFNNFFNNAPFEFNTGIRKLFKKCAFRGIFDTYATIGAHVKREISFREEKYDSKEWGFVDSIMSDYKSSIEKATGGSLQYDSEIFLHESCIYMDVLEDLLHKGYKVTQIYDGFYTDKPVPDMDKIVEEKALNYYNTYIKKEKKSILADCL